MKRRVTVALIPIVLIAGFVGASIATAQDEPTQVGEEVTFIDPDGIIRGTISVREVADPFTGYDPSYQAEPGTRYIALTVTYQAALDQTFDAQPSEIMLQSDDGRLWTTIYVPRPADVTNPDLQSQQLAPDNRISGLVTFAVPQDTVIERVVYEPAYDRLIDLLVLTPGAGPAAGGATTYTDAEGGSASVSVDVTDPFGDFDANYPPADGDRYVMLHPIFENTGEQPYLADSYDFAVRDANGFVYTATTVYQAEPYAIPPLESQTMSPGDRVSGLVGLTVPADAQLTEVVYYPESGRMVTVADLDGAATAPPPEPAAPESAPPLPSPEPVVVPSPTPDPSAGIGR